MRIFSKIIKNYKRAALIGVLILLSQFATPNSVLAQTPPTTVSLIPGAPVEFTRDQQDNLRRLQQWEGLMNSHASQQELDNFLMDEFKLPLGDASEADRTALRDYFNGMAVKDAENKKNPTAAAQTDLQNQLKTPPALTSPKDPFGANNTGLLGAGQTGVDAAGGFLGGRAIAIIGTILGLFLSIVSFFFSFLARFVAELLLMVLKFNNFTDLPQIKEAWIVLRDLSNMFFIVVLIAIAFGTMLHIEGYEWKSLLPRLLVMAILVNFSKAIAGFMIDVSQIVMLTFVKAFSDNTNGGGVMSVMGVSGDMWNLTWQAFKSIAGVGIQGPVLIVAAMMLSFFYVITATSILLMMVVILVYRIVMLWVLVILSPLAYVMDTFPQGTKYSTMWWEKFIAEVTTGPVLAFFIWLALKVGQDVKVGSGTYSGGAAGHFDNWSNINWQSFAGISGDISATGREAIADFANPSRFINLLISTAIFSGGMMLASQLGAAGGEMAGNLTGKLSEFGKMATGGAFARIAKAGYNTYDRFMATKNPYLSPTSLMKGWEGYWQEKEHEAFSTSPGKVQDFLFKKFNVTLGTGDKHIPGFLKPAYAKAQQFFGGEALSGRTTKYERRMRGAHVDKVMRDYAGATMGAEETAKVFMEAEGRGNEEEQEALLKLIVRNNMQDDFMRVYFKEKKTSVLPDSLMQRIDKNSQKAVAKAGARAQILSPANIGDLNASSLGPDGRTVNGLDTMPPLPPPGGTGSVPPTPPTGGTPGTPQNAGSAAPKVSLAVNIDNSNPAGGEPTVTTSSGDSFSLDGLKVTQTSAKPLGEKSPSAPSGASSISGSSSSGSSSGAKASIGSSDGFALEGADKETKRILRGLNPVAASRAKSLIAEEIKKRKIYDGEGDKEGSFIDENEEGEGDDASSLNGHYRRDSELDIMIGNNPKYKLDREKVHELMRTEMMARGVSLNNINQKEYNDYRDWALKKLTNNEIRT